MGKHGVIHRVDGFFFAGFRGGEGFFRLLRRYVAHGHAAELFADMAFESGKPLPNRVVNTLQHLIQQRFVRIRRLELSGKYVLILKQPIHAVGEAHRVAVSHGQLAVERAAADLLVSVEHARVAAQFLGRFRATVAEGHDALQRLFAAESVRHDVNQRLHDTLVRHVAERCGRRTGIPRAVFGVAHAVIVVERKLFGRDGCPVHKQTVRVVVIEGFVAEVEIRHRGSLRFKPRPCGES